MKKAKLIIGTLLLFTAIFTACETEENEAYDFEAIDKEEIQEEGER